MSGKLFYAETGFDATIARSGATEVRFGVEERRLNGTRSTRLLGIALVLVLLLSGLAWVASVPSGSEGGAVEPVVSAGEEIAVPESVKTPAPYGPRRDPR